MVRAYAFMAGLLVYALFSAPTPDRIGIAEILVLAGLLVGIGVSGVMQTAGLSVEEPAPRWHFPARLLLLFGLSVPLVTGLAQGHLFSLVLRDIIPFLFLLLPLFLSPSFINRVPLAKLFPYMLCLMGLIFVVRVMASFAINVGAGHFPLGFMPDPGNLVNAPTVLFAALFLSGTGGLWLIESRTVPEALRAGGCFLLALALLAGMAGIGQRAHIGAWALTVALWTGMLAVKRPLSLWRIGLVLAVVSIALWPFATEILTGLAQKTSMVGLNNRAEEALAVWESFRDRPLALLFGQGWGASITSPAVGPYPVNYTHSLLTTYLLKTGLCGLVLVLAYLGMFAGGIWRILWAYPVAGLAVAAPFLIDITLYASFKTLDFGLLLVLIALWTRCPPQGR